MTNKHDKEDLTGATEAAASKTPRTPSVEGIMVLDGGMGHMLRGLGVEISGLMGSQQRLLGVALAIVENPEVVVEVHAAFLIECWRIWHHHE